MDNSELPEEITALIKTAEGGNAVAQFRLGIKYDFGDGVEQSASKAVVWYQKAAEQGHSGAQCYLGISYQYGQGISQSNDMAVEWYRKAAEQGFAPAQCNLGVMYEKGLGVAQNYSTAADLYRKAAISGIPNAQCNLGYLYENGRGVEQNVSTALEWYHKASEQGYARAQNNLGCIYFEGRTIAQNYNMAAKWYRKADKGGDTNATINLGMMYLQGIGVKQSVARAKALSRKAIRNASPKLRFQALEFQDQTERFALSPHITNIRKRTLDQLKAPTGSTMTHYTSLLVGNALLLEPSALRLGHINALNDPNEGKLLWLHLGYSPVESKPAFVGCFLPDEDSLNMWRFYSKNHQKEDACGCAITFNTDNFFEFDLLSKKPGDAPQDANNQAFLNSGKAPQESAAFYRVVYIKGEMDIRGEDERGTLKQLFDELKTAVINFLGTAPDKEKLQQLTWLLGPLPYLLKDADYEAEKEHRIIVTHLEYGAKEIQVQEPDLMEGTPPRLYLEMHRANHLAPIKHVTLGPKSPNQEMMAPYWHHQLASKFPEQLQAKPDFYIKASRCAYQ